MKNTTTTLMNTDDQKSYYCSQKFWWLSVDIDRSQILSCCAASPENINTDWLINNPGKLFNTPKLQQERHSMLQNIPVQSCKQTCWNAESNNLPSRRLIMSSNHTTHRDINAEPETLHIILGNDCNMSCVYCCKQYSSTWARDILDQGPYQVDISDDRYRINAVDKILLNLSQKELATSKKRNVILDEISNLDKKNIKAVTITGGEPFLSLSLNQTVLSLNSEVTIKVWSGLGVDPARFRKECEKIKNNNLEIVISAENVGDFYEFNRSGNSWKRFCQNIDILDELQIKYSFNATVSNLTLFGLPDFIQWIKGKEVTWGVCNDPEFLAPNILDDISKTNIINNLSCFPEKVQTIITQSFDIDSDPKTIHNLKSFLLEYTRRKKKSWEIFPRHFLDWVSAQ